MDMDHMVNLANLGRLRGDVVERATLSRDLLAPVAARLSGGAPPHRCVLARYIGFFRRPDDVRADLVSFGDVEAVAVCRVLHMAVAVFRTADGAAAALRKHAKAAETRIIGLCSPVPPLYLAFPSCFIQPGLIEVAVYPPTSGDASTKAAAAVPTQPVESRPVFINTPPSERPRNMARGPPGTTEFVPYLESKVNGPRLGADGHLWMDGIKFTYFEKGMQIDEDASAQVVQVAPPNYYAYCYSFFQ